MTSTNQILLLADIPVPDTRLASVLVPLSIFGFAEASLHQTTVESIVSPLTVVPRWTRTVDPVIKEGEGVLHSHQGEGRVLRKGGTKLRSRSGGGQILSDSGRGQIE